MEEIRLDKVTETLSVYQRKGVFCYGTDAVLLVRFVEKYEKYLTKQKLCDLCAGTGIIPLMLCDAHKELTAALVEINADAAALSEKSAEVSGLSDRVTVKNADLKTVRTLFEPECFDLVTCNPPYMTASCGKMCGDDAITLARHEIACTVDDVFASAFYLLPTGGSLYMVYRTDRLSDLMAAAKNNRFEIKQMCFVRSGKAKETCELVLVKAKKQASVGMRVTACDVEKLQ